MVRDNVKLKDVFTDLAPEFQSVISGMITELGKDQETITVGETLKLKPIAEMPWEEKRATLALMGVNNGKYVAKLDHDKRCQVLALYRMGITREALAAMFNINARTVGHIYNKDSVHYKLVRAEEQALGTEKFIQKHTNDDLFNRAMSYRQTAENEAIKNNKYAKGKEGVHQVRPASCNHVHTVVIRWRDEDGDNPAGWYYQDRDGDFPNEWLSSGEESLRTSMDCFRGLLRNITDKAA